MAEKAAEVSGKERRKSVRTKTRAWVRAEYNGVEYSLRDLSTGGAFMRTKHPPRPGDEIDLLLNSIRLEEPIKVLAEVRSRRENGCGLQFLRFEGRGQLALADLLSSLVVPRILILASDEDLRRNLTHFLVKQSFSVLAAEDAGEALLLATESQLDMFILDLDLEGSVSGLETLQQFRGIPHNKNVPIVVLSGLRDSSLFASARELGAIGCVPKPVKPTKLLAFMGTVLEQ
jgi:CheY-like chemotaxis protein